MITKSLLKVLLNKEVEDIKYIDENYIHYRLTEYEELEYDFISIHDLAYKCKVWATKRGFSYLGNMGKLNIHSINNSTVIIINKSIINWYDPIIDFIACEWILNNDTYIQPTT